MKKRKILKILIPIVAIAIVAAVTTWYLTRYNIPVFEGSGELARKERGLILFASILAIIVVVPTFTFTIWTAYKYNEKNHTKRTEYRPDFGESWKFETGIWGIPIVIIAVLSVVAWNSAHDLDPFKSLASAKKPLVVQVVSLDWKWLFIYPEQSVASVNLAEIPVGTPVDFQVTSDTIMNSFWVPGLGGQIYSMPGMITHLHEQTDQPGDFLGSPANIAGKGFSRMDFTIRAASQQKFNNWIANASAAERPLDKNSYAKLSKPSMSVPVSYYSSVPNGFFESIAMKYMMPNSKSGSAKMNDENMSGMKPTKPTVSPKTMPGMGTSGDGQQMPMPAMKGMN